MAKILKYGDAGFIDWTGQENEQINFRPFFIGDLPTEMGIRIELSVKSKRTLHFFGNLEKVLMPYAKGFQGGNKAPKLQKTVYLVEFKAEQSFDKHEYIDMIYYEVVNKGGVEQNSIEGTAVIDAERRVFFNAIKKDVIRNFWLGDTTKVHTVAGTYPDGTAYAIGDPDKYYNQIDGILTKMMADASTTPTGEEIQKVDMPATLAADDADAVMLAMEDAASDVLDELIEAGECYFYATKGFIKNWRNTIMNDGTEAAHRAKIDGVNYYIHNGIMIKPLPISSHLKNDFGAAMPKEFCLLTTPQNLALILNVRSSFAETRFWFNPDENENRQRTQFEFGVDYILPELAVISYKA